MVAVSDLQKASMLRGESEAIGRALEGLAAGDAITAMTIGPPGGNPLRPMGVTISTVGISYPPAMVETIKTTLTARRGEIEQALRDLGVTGIGGSS